MKGFNYRWYVEFFHANSRFFSSLVPQMLLVIVLYLIFEVFFAGGFYSAFVSRKGMKISEFFARGASSFFPLLGVTAVEGAVLIVLYGGNSLWANFNEQAARTAASASAVLHAELWRYGFVVAAFVVISLLSDFTRAAVAVDVDDYWYKIKRGFMFGVKHPVSTFGVYLGCTLISLSVIGIGLFYNFRVAADSEASVILGIAAGQIFILLRIFSKLIFYASEAVLYKEDQIEVIKVKPEMLE